MNLAFIFSEGGQVPFLAHACGRHGKGKGNVDLYSAAA